MNSSLNLLFYYSDSISFNTLILPADVARTELPSIVPPSYRGATIRYFYYVRCTLSGRWLVLENGHSPRESRKDLIELVIVYCLCNH